ncbi:hypothetical protein [Arthrobacter sp. MYb227]|nr:hypothetical protein [Arthrobacter sp. MYb227]
MVVSFPAGMGLADSYGISGADLAPVGKPALCSQRRGAPDLDPSGLA